MELTDKCHIITLSETWLKRGTQYGKNFKLENFYEIERKDRINDRYGGVAVWIHKSLYFNRMVNLETNYLEVLWIEVKYNNIKFFLGTVYRPPNATLEWWDLFQDNINTLRATCPNTGIILTGDFNCHLGTANGNILENFCIFNNLSIEIREPTRITDKSSTILDQFITSNHDTVEKTHVIPPLMNCDHCTIIIYLNFKIFKSKNYCRRMWTFDENQFNNYRESLKDIDFSFCDINRYK